MRSVCQLTAGLRYYFYNAPVDMRKSFHSPEGLVVEQFGRYLIGDEVFVFLGKNGRTVKMLLLTLCCAKFGGLKRKCFLCTHKMML